MRLEAKRIVTIGIFFLVMLNALEVHTKEIFRFGYSSSQNPEILISRMTPMLNIISVALDADIEFIHKKTFSEMQKAYINQEIDFGIINAYSYLRILPYDAVVPIASRVIEGSRMYQSYFFTRKDSGIESIKDLKGKTVALGDPYSTSSYLIPHFIFNQHGIHPDSDLKKTIIISKQDSCILSVMNRTADAGVAASFIFNEQPEAVISSLTIFYTSEPFPLGPFIANKNIKAPTVEILKQTLLSLSETEEGKSALDSASIEDFQGIEEDTYLPLLRIKNSLNLN